MRSASRAIALAERGQHALGQLQRRAGLAQAALNDRELVAAKPRERIRLPQTGGDPLRHRDQQPIADDVAVAVVDRLEVIDVEAVQGDELAASDRRGAAPDRAGRRTGGDWAGR